MMKVKEFLKELGAHIWETIKSSILLLLFYGMLSSIAFMGMMNTDWTGDVAEGLNGSRTAWVVVIVLLLAGYNALLAYGMGGKGYEMLVSGNMKRISAQQLGSSYKISSHKEVQEYRAWKGFAFGGVVAFFVLLFGILMGANADGVNELMRSLANPEAGLTTNKGAAAVALVSMLLSGWSVLPFVFMNIAGATVSYYWSCLFALIPIAVSGALYIMGAYGKRAKSIKAQEEADRAAATEAAKPKKINYGGLPGTKPKKRKK